MRQVMRPGVFLLLLGALGIAHGQEAAVVGPGADARGDEAPSPWLDRTQQGIYATVQRTAMRIDGIFGGPYDERAYSQASGSVAPVLLWDEYDGFRPRFRFNVNLPLPRLDERFDAFIGRVSREEYVTERARRSGAFREPFSQREDDQTLFGVRFREKPREGGSFSAGAGLRVRFPMDPYVKGAYSYQRGELDRALLSLKETVFWQNSEGVGLTSRVDVERIFDEVWLGRWTGSATISEESNGVRGYTTLSALRGFPGRRAVAGELFMTGEFDAPVALAEYGTKVAYRQSVLRDWLVLEVRTSVTWPKERPDEPRAPSWGLGLGFEMYFGDEKFSAQPITF